MRRDGKIKGSQSGMVIMEWAGEKLRLMPERAVWWRRKKTVFIADPHFGKASAFRFAGIPVPEASQYEDLVRLDTILDKTAATRLIILGDFFHAKTGRTPETLRALAEWRGRLPALELVLVIGNHDRRAGCPPEEWDIKCVEEPWGLAPFLCAHHPNEVEGGFVLAGHLHPAFRLGEKIGGDLSARCFYFGDRIAILPAFGNFTGSHRIRPKPGGRVFLAGAEEVIDVSRAIRQEND